MISTKVTTPVFLNDFDIETSLCTWKSGTELGVERKSWEVRSFGNSILCRLSFTFYPSDNDTSGQLGSVEMSATSIKEAVWLCLEKYSNWCRQYSESRSQ